MYLCVCVRACMHIGLWTHASSTASNIHNINGHLLSKKHASTQCSIPNVLEQSE